MLSNYRTGNVYAYFVGAGDEYRIALMVGDGWYDHLGKLFEEEFEIIIDYRGIYSNNWFYWTRSTASGGDNLRYVNPAGDFSYAYGHIFAYDGFIGVRPALNLIAITLVSEAGY